MPSWSLKQVSSLFTMFSHKTVGIRSRGPLRVFPHPLPKEKVSELTCLDQDGPVNFPVSELNVYISFPRGFDGFLRSPAWNSPIYGVKGDEKERKAMQDLETNLWDFFSIGFTKTSKNCLHSGLSDVFFFPLNEILVRSYCTYAFWQPLIKEPYVTFLQGLKILVYTGPTNWKVLVERWLNDLNTRNDQLELQDFLTEGSAFFVCLVSLV